MVPNDEFRRYKGFLCRKWEDELPDVDFNVIRQRTSLSFDEDSQQAIRRLLGTYERDLQVWENLPAREVKKRLRAIVKACGDLLPILKAGNARFVPDALAAEVGLRNWTTV